MTAAVAAAQEQAAADRDAAVHAALHQAAVLQRQQLDQVAAHHRELLEQAGARQREQLGVAPGRRRAGAGGQEGRHRHPAGPGADRAASRRWSASGSWSASWASATPSSSARWTNRSAPRPRSPRRSRPAPRACGRPWPTRRPGASGASAWPRTSCAWPGSSSTSTTRSRPPSRGTRPARLHVHLPKGHALYMDVKFPLSAYLRFLEAGTEAERHGPPRRLPPRRPARVRELAQRDYAPWVTVRPSTTSCSSSPTSPSPGSSTSSDPGLVEHALGQKVVLCSPLTLFAFLGRHPSGLRQLRHRADLGRDPHAARQVRPAVGEVRGVVGERGAQVLRRPQGAGAPRRAPAADAREAAAAAQRAAPQARPGDRHRLRARCWRRPRSSSWRASATIWEREPQWRCG